jgi:hypothetical protein
MDEIGWQSRKEPTEQNILRRPAAALKTAVYQARLYRVVHEAINMFCGARGRVRVTAFLDCYERFMDWKASLPPDIDDSDNSFVPLPFVLNLQ